MKKLILSIIAIAAVVTSAKAQSDWKMVITQTDGTKVEIPTTEVKDIRYVENGTYTADANVDQIVIKELYNGGCQKDDGKSFQQDKCIILYNNCPEQAVVNNLCIAFASPYNGHANNKNYTDDGRLTYETEKFTPAFGGCWWYPHSLVIEPYSQVVINICGAIDNTQTYSNSVNYAHADYYCMYDPASGFNNSSWYPAPSAAIPTSHYLNAKRLGTANAWSVSNSSPAVFIFQTKDIAPADFAENADNIWYDGGEAKDINACLKVPNDWIIDGIEVYQASRISDSRKRLTADIDAGFVGLTNQLGHTLYRNVDKEATEALPENAGKLVHDYALGVDGSTDGSGIDAEASMKNGAHIVFIDTNNSTNDFHERQKCSLRD